MNWHIGQRIVAVKDHADGDIKKGDEYVINSLSNGCCGVLIGIGIYHPETYYACCKKCNYKKLIIAGQEFPYHESFFRPLDELSDYTTDELIEEIETSVLCSQHGYF